MIQRIQTIYLLLSLICSVLLFFLPVWQGDQVYTAMYLLLFPIALLLIVSHLISIFLYKNRKRQKQFCTGNILLYIIFLLWAMVIIQLEHQVFQHFNLLEFRLG